MVGKLVHRGPDDEGFHVTPDIAIGMRRLSIIDVAHGQQPMFGENKRYSIVFNGEIYNHRKLRAEFERNGRAFETSADTEVVLAAFEQHGLDGFKRLEGMFSIAVWDEREKQLVMARDWMGQKSLYWTRCDLGFAFASEIKALIELPGVHRELDTQAMSHYMSMRYLPGDATFFRGIFKIPAAHACMPENGNPKLIRLWTPRYDPKKPGKESALLDGLDELMKEVVGEHLMSEVPLGAFLSGGIDSSLVVAYAAEASQRPLRTFSIGVAVEAQSELPWARQVAERYGTEHMETIVEPDLASLTPRMVHAMEEPVDPLACGVFAVSEVTSAHVTVALGGDGGDELFAGYDRYKGQALAEMYAYVPRAIRHGLLRPIINRLPDSYGYNSLTSKVRWLDQVSDNAGFERYAMSAAILRFPHWRKQELFTESAWAAVSQSVSEQLLKQYWEDGSASSFLDRMLHTDCSTRLADHQLVIADKMSMAHSLELRSPFVDRRIAEFAMQIPADLKLKSRRIKYFTRRLSERYLPRELIYRPKQGFSFPIALWLRDELRGLLNRVVEESRLVEAGIFRRETMRKLVDEHTSGRQDHNYRLWMLFNLEIFWRYYFDDASISDLEQWIGESRGTAKQVAPTSSQIQFRK